MPGGYGFIFPYHMTPDNSLGLVFNHYDLSPLDNDVIEEALVEATNRYDREIAGDPTLANQTLDRQWQYDHNPHDQGEDYYTLFINPVDPAMTYGDIPTLIAVLAEWATQYQTCKTDFHIYARPGTGEERRLGWGNILQII